MTSILNSHLDSFPSCEPTGYSPADSLDIRGAILAPGLMLSQDSDGSLSLYKLSGGHASKLGTFASAADAWRAVDEIDLVDEHELVA